VTKILAAKDGKKVAADKLEDAGDIPSVLSRKASDNAAPFSLGIDVPRAEATFPRILATFNKPPKFFVAASFMDLPANIQQDAYNQDSDENIAKGLFHDGTLYLVAGNHSTMEDLEATIFHELFGHYGMRTRPSLNATQKLNAFFARLPLAIPLHESSKYVRKAAGDEQVRNESSLESVKQGLIGVGEGVSRALHGKCIFPEGSRRASR